MARYLLAVTVLVVAEGEDAEAVRRRLLDVLEADGAVVTVSAPAPVREVGR